MYKTDLIFFKIKQGDFMNILSSNHSDIFSIATLIYTRLRRVSGRVIDVMYMVESESYTQHVMELAKKTQDAELIRLVTRLSTLVCPPIMAEVEAQNNEESTELFDREVTKEPDYQAQVAHHYIGALR
jgi:DNA-binding FrmR family transcriptional regulator